MKDVKIQLEPVQETLLLPLWARALEAEQPKPIIVDPHAVEFIKRIDYDFTQIKRGFEITRLVWPIRAATFDTALRTFIAAHPRATIVNLGAGLDTTFFRVDNGQIQWFDVDLPEVIALRQQFVSENDRLHHIAESAWGKWTEQIPRDQPVMIIAAGLLFYYPQAEVEQLLAQIAITFPNGTMLLDYIAPIFCGPTKKYRWGIWDAMELSVQDVRIDVQQQWRYYNQFPSRWPWPYQVLRPLVLRLNGMAQIAFG
ncbi:MAG TPA: class I SAM-dependent methyltransferase [Anaerolineae bacterium]|nr:class I SAM-dependent methyltransferase [Anaerolineae bacterium]